MAFSLSRFLKYYLKSYFLNILGKVKNFNKNKKLIFITFYLKIKY